MKFMGKCFCAIRNKSNIITTAIFLAQFFYDLIICDRPKVHCEFISSVRSNDPIKKSIHSSIMTIPWYVSRKVLTFFYFFTSPCFFPF